MKDPYQILQILPTASDEEVKKAYRKLSKQYHPDLHTDKADQQQAEQRFVEIQKAYQQVMRERQSRGNGCAAQDESWRTVYGPGYGGYDYGRKTQEDASSGMRAAKVYIDTGYYAQAVHALSQCPPEERSARWYFLSAQAQMGLQHLAQALEYARRATSMEPGNVQYRQFYSALQSGAMRYNAWGQAYGRSVPSSANLCTTLMMTSVLCNCLGGGGCCWLPICCC